MKLEKAAKPEQWAIEPGIIKLTLLLLWSSYA
jgi:hypothetical protein